MCCAKMLQVGGTAVALPNCVQGSFVVAVLLLLLDLVKYARMRARVCVTRRARIACAHVHACVCDVLHVLPRSRSSRRSIEYIICTENRFPLPNRDAAPNVKLFCVHLIGTKASSRGPKSVWI